MKIPPDSRSILSARTQFFLVALFLLAALGIAPKANAQSGTEVAELTKLRDQLSNLVENRERERTAARQTAAQKVREASRTPAAAANAYAEAFRSTQLEGKVGQAGEFSDWQKRNASWLSNSDFRSAVQLHLQYLALSMDRAASKKPEDFLHPARQHLLAVAELQKRFTTSEPPNQAREILQTGIKNSPFTQAWQLQPFLEIEGPWSESSGQIEQLLQNNIRPVLRERKSPELLETYDWQIQFEADLLQRERRQHAREQFEKVRRPTLLLEKAEAQAQLGQVSRAAASALQVLQENAAHPDFNRWAEKIAQWLESAAPTEPNPSAEAPATQEVQNPS